MTSGTVVHDSSHPRKVGRDVVPTVQVRTAEELRHRQGKYLSQNHAKELRGQSQNCFRHQLLIFLANTLRREEFTELESLSLNSQDCLFHAAEENDGWHKAYVLSVLCLTLCSLLKKIGMWFTLAKAFAWNKCWHWVVVNGTANNQFWCSPESWGLETAAAQLPLPHCQKQNALWGNESLNIAASIKTTQRDAAVAGKRCYVKAV